MSSLQNIPLWVVALVLAVAAPWCVGLLQSSLEERRRERTRKLLHNLGMPVDERGATGARSPGRTGPRDISQPGDEDP